MMATGDQELIGKPPYELPASAAARERDFINHVLAYYAARVNDFVAGLSPLHLNILLAFVSGASAAQLGSDWLETLTHGMTKFTQECGRIKENAVQSGVCSANDFVLLIPEPPNMKFLGPPDPRVYLGEPDTRLVQ
jgi:hypothetical protein